MASKLKYKGTKNPYFVFATYFKWKMNHKNNKKKVNNYARDERRKKARNRRKQAWHDPMVNAFGVRVQNYQGLFFTKGTEAAEAPRFNHAFNKRLDNRYYCKQLQIDRVVSRRGSPSSSNVPVTVPGRDEDGKWKVSPQKMYLRQLKKEETNDLYSLKDWVNKVRYAIDGPIV